MPLVDVTSTLSAAAADGHPTLVSPVTGRKLKLSKSLVNPSGVWYAGSKRAYDFWPDGLVSRISSQRRKAFNVEHARLVAQAQKELDAFEPTKPAAKDGAAAEDTDKNPENGDALRKAELKARLSVLQTLHSDYDDPGPILEAVVYYDGKHFRAVVGGGEGEPHDAALGLPDYSLQPNLAAEEATVDLSACDTGLTDFRTEREWRFFGSMDRLSYSVNILTDGPAVPPAGKLASGNPSKPTTLSIVSVSGSHGTHVAGIVGAYFPPSAPSSEGGPSDDEAAKNGVAPKCEIVTLRIGDPRVGTMETGQALLRAARALIDTKCDIANLSFGEDGAFGVEDRGAFAKALRDHVIRERDIIFVSSAGNNGPALTTVGQPGGTTSSVLSVGAYVTAGPMQQAEYAAIETPPDNATTWSSRGPTADGDRGVGIYAPGAAITSIPVYTLSQTMLANGTSMSSPNASGSIALLVSAMKQEEIPVTPARVLKAVRDSGKDVNDDLGVPFIQVEKAWEHLSQWKDHPAQDAEFRVTVTPPGKPLSHAGTNKRGIYLREPAETSRLTQYQVTVKPALKEHETDRQWALQLPVALIASEPWVQAPQFVFLGSNGRTFEVRVDAAALQPGLHHATVSGYDTDNPGHKLFEVPVTVAKPEVPQSAAVRYTGLRLSKGQVTRRFLAVPEGATWASLKVRTYNHANSGVAARLWLHLVQLEPHKRLHSVETAPVLSAVENEPTVKKFPVRGGITLEVATAEYFMAEQAFEFDLDIDFHGIEVRPTQVTLVGGEGLARIECQSLLRPEPFAPAIKFEHRRTYIRPTQADVRALTSARDRQTDGKPQLELVTSYPLKVTEKESKVQLSLPTSGHVYDAAVPLLLQVFDANKKRVQFADVYPHEVTLPKGEYTVHAQMLHTDVAVLTKLKTAVLTAFFKLAKPGDIKLDVYEDQVELIGAEKPPSLAGIKLLPGERKVLVLDTALEQDKLPKDAAPGDVLSGTLGFGEAAVPLKYVVPPHPKKDKDDDAPPASEDEDEQTQTIDLLVEAGKKIKKDEDKLAFFDKLALEYPTHLGLLQAKLETLAPIKVKANATDAKVLAAETRKIIAAADAVLAQVDLAAIRLHLGTKHAPAAEQTSAERKAGVDMDKRKAAAVLALHRKARALLLAEGVSAPFAAAWKEYRSFFPADASDADYTALYAAWAGASGRYAVALEAVLKAAADLGAGSADSIDRLNTLNDQALDLLGPGKLTYTAWAAHLARWRVLARRADYEGF